MFFVWKTLFLIACLLWGCQRPSVDQPTHADITPEAYYAQNPDFFIFKTEDDLPQDLDWQHHLDQPEFADIDAPKGGMLRLMVSDFPRTLRMVGPDANSGLRSVLYDKNMIGLVSIHPHTRAYIPGLAQEWAISPDNQTVYFKLNPQARYDDGVPVRVKDFFYLFYFMRSTHIQDPWYNNWYSTQFSSITQFDDLTFCIRLSHPKPYPLSNANQIPIPSHYFGTLSSDFPRRYQWAFPPTTGPYRLRPEDIKKGRSLTLSRVCDWWAKNERYYRGRFNVDHIHYKVVRDPSKAFFLFIKNQLDAIDMSLPELWYKRSQAPAFKKGYVYRVVFYHDMPRAINGIMLNEQKGLLTSKAIRQGIAHALDLDEANRVYLHDDFKRLRVYAQGYGLYSNPDIALIDYSPEKARHYFAQAGFTQAGADGILKNQQGQKLQITLTIPTGPQQNMYALLREKAKAAGLDLQIEALDHLTVYKKIMNKNYEATHILWKNHYVPLPMMYKQMFHSDYANRPNTNNLSNTADPHLDELIEAYERQTAVQLLQALSRDIQAAIAERYCYIPTFYSPFYRWGFWRWICFPPGFNAPLSADPIELGLFWIDPARKQQTLDAQQDGYSWGECLKIYD